MPIYEYHCADCDHSFETFVRPGEIESECPTCHGSNIAREMSVFASARASDSAGPTGAASGGGCCGGSCGCG
ncbi:MAG TPA: zinc ribbon domain-containing protein [Candidatus Binataceae bacterium]|jgi:putative FmdB family regulatory protein|nr:zinc ribbon domain-containing protein [Candidatus Binataceae bacterium]